MKAAVVGVNGDRHQAVRVALNFGFEAHQDGDSVDLRRSMIYEFVSFTDVPRFLPFLSRLPNADDVNSVVFYGIC